MPSALVVAMARRRVFPAWRGFCGCPIDRPYCCPITYNFGGNLRSDEPMVARVSVRGGTTVPLAAVARLFSLVIQAARQYERPGRPRGIKNQEPVPRSIYMGYVSIYQERKRENHHDRGPDFTLLICGFIDQ